VPFFQSDGERECFVKGSYPKGREPVRTHRSKEAARGIEVLLLNVTLLLLLSYNAWMIPQYAKVAQYFGTNQFVKPCAVDKG
jgi:hypothetical protein